MTTQTTSTWSTLEELSNENSSLQKYIQTANAELNRVNDERYELKATNTKLLRDLEAWKEEDAKSSRLARTQAAIIQSLNKKAKEFPLKVDRETQVKRVSFADQQTEAKEDQDSGDLKKRLDDTQTLLDKKTNEITTLKGECNKLRQTNINPSSEPVKDMERIIDERFNNIQEKIEISIEKLITKKFAENGTNLQQIEDKIQGVIATNETFAERANVGAGPSFTKENFTSALQSSRNDELIEQKEKDKRMNNLIIYNVDETDSNDCKKHDQDFVSAFLDTIGVVSRPKEVIRLGTRTDNRHRPLKLTMKNNEDKEQIKSRLVNLREADEIYRKVSVRDDYTLKERDLVKDMVQQAKEKNENEGTDAWKVRGTPKNGLRLVKITRRR